MAWKTSSKPSLIFKESSVKGIWEGLCWFGQIYIISNIRSLLQKFCFPAEHAINYLQTQKDLELVFSSLFL